VGLLLIALVSLALPLVGLEAFLALRPTDPTVLDRDLHLTAAGHALVARQVYDFLRREHLPLRRPAGVSGGPPVDRQRSREPASSAISS
jgi:hypothetical protein